MQKGKTIRDKDMLHDVHIIGNTIPNKSTITVNQDLATDYVLECYFIRYFNISLYIDEPKEYLMLRKTTGTPGSADFEKLNIQTKLYDVYKHK
jgi:hypothetical protein